MVKGKVRPTIFLEYCNPLMVWGHPFRDSPTGCHTRFLFRCQSSCRNPGTLLTVRFIAYVSECLWIRPLLVIIHVDIVGFRIFFLIEGVQLGHALVAQLILCGEVDHSLVCHLELLIALGRKAFGHERLESGSAY